MEVELDITFREDSTRPTLSTKCVSKGPSQDESFVLDCINGVSHPIENQRYPEFTVSTNTNGKDKRKIIPDGKKRVFKSGHALGCHERFLRMNYINND